MSEQTDEKEAKAAVERVLALADEWELRAGEDSAAWRAFGPQDVSVPFAVKSIRDAVNPPAPTTGEEPR